MSMGPEMDTKINGMVLQMELTRNQKFTAMYDKHTNLRDCDGMIIHPVAFLTRTYDDQDGKQHSVLVILNGIDNKFYRTEVSAFIEKFLQYDETFGDLPDEEKPKLVINLRTSRKGNKYVNFDLVEEN